MNYITSCPKCDTQFLLSDEHIKVQRGKVQCGHCEHVFNAKNRLTPVSEEAESNLQSPEIPDINTANAGDQAIANTENFQIAATANNEPPAVTGAAFNDTYTEYVPYQELDKTVAAGDLLTINLNDNSSIPSEKNLFSINDLTINSELAKPAAKKTRRWLWLIIPLIIAGLLQTVYSMRSQISAYYPQFKPLMTQMCQQLGCNIDLPQHLESIVIGESDMQEHENYQSVINFSTSIVNNANYIQAFPNIELTLTNADDNAVIRKIITPPEYLPQGAEIQNGLAAHEELHVKLPVYVDHEVVTGYRVQLIY